MRRVFAFKIFIFKIPHLSRRTAAGRGIGGNGNRDKTGTVEGPGFGRRTSSFTIYPP
jgi:hypothetical protein